MATALTAGQAGQLQILVQDDCSPDFNPLELIGPPALVERNAVNIGFAGNCNAGAARALGDILFFLNQDTVAQPDWFDWLLVNFANEKIGIVGPKLVFPPGTDPTRPENTIQSCGGLFDGGRGPYHRYLGYAADDWRVNQRERVSWTTGAALAIRRELFFRVGGFDVAYQRGYFEDVDLCMKAVAAGYEIGYEPQSCFTHHVGSSGGISPEVFKANSMLFHRRWDNQIVPDTGVIHVNY